MKERIVTILICLFLGVSITSCSLIEQYNEKQDLYNKVEYFVNNLNSVYSSYGIEGVKYTKYTKHCYYKITPIGRLINVRIEDYVEFAEYQELKNDLKKHFKSNITVNDVYICNGGTIIVDCRY